MKKTFKHYLPETIDILILILTLLEYRLEGDGVESGYRKGHMTYWFCDDGSIEVIESI
jgi:hypothetical protein